jgi:hypothetical protein
MFLKFGDLGPLFQEKKSFVKVAFFYFLFFAFAKK